MSQAFILASVGGLVSALATVIGSSASYFRTRGGYRLTAHISLDFALGMMLSAASVSLLLPAGQEAVKHGPAAIASVALAFFGGILFISVVGLWMKATPRFQPKSKAGSDHGAHTSAWLFVVAMMFHNFPEGLASGAALGGMDLAQGLPILGAIAIQNLPEGLATVAAFSALGLKHRTAYLGGVASGVVELIGGIVGGLLLGMVANVLPILLAFAGGAMLYVSLCEAIERFAVPKLEPKRMMRDIAFGAAVMAVLTFMF